MVPYLNTLDGPFLYDDTVYVVENPQVRSPGAALSSFASSYPPNRPRQGLYRPATVLSYAFDHAVGGMNPFVFHLANVALHAAATMSAYLLLRAWSPEQAAWAAMLFAVHPAHGEAIAWIVGRAELLCGLFLFLALGAGPRLRPLGPVLVLLALLSKETAITAPALVLLPLLVTGWGDVRGRARTAAGMLAAASVYLAARAWVLGALTPQGQQRTLEGLSLPSRLPATFESYAAYVRLMVAPARLAVAYPWKAVPRWADPAVVAGLSLFVLLAAAAVLLARRAPWFALGIAWFDLALLPVSHLIPIGATYAERFLYIPSLGVCLVLAGILARLGSRRVAATFMTVLVLAGATRTMARNQVWRDAERFYQAALAVSPDHATLVNNLGRLYADRADLARAEPLFERAVRLDAMLAPALSNLGVIRARQGRLAEARDLLERAVASDPAYVHGHNNLGNLYALLGRGDEAVREYQKALDLNPSDPGARENLDKLLTGR